MLTSDLLVTRIRGDTITPKFLEPGGDALELAGDLIASFKSHAGRTMGDLWDLLEEMGEEGFDYRQIRGLVALLERRCVLQVDSSLQPASARKAAFAAASALYPLTSAEKREIALKSAAETAGATPQEIEKALFADLDKRLVVKEFRQLSPEELVRSYNLSLAQTLLFKATELTFYASGGHKDVLRGVKMLGLMYTARVEGDGVEITIDGPASVLKMTERYGTLLARLLPLIVSCESWSIRAMILRKDFTGSPRLYRLELSGKAHGSLFPASVQQESFDSETEKEFAEVLGNMAGGWVATREPEPLIAGKYLLIPDFLLEKNGIKAYVEIAGFWTPDYLSRKLAKLEEIKDKNLIVLAGQGFACDALKNVSGRVIFFDRKMPVKEIHDALEALESKSLDDELKRLEKSGISIKGEIASVEALAREYGVTESAIRRLEESGGVEGYFLAGQQLIADGYLGSIEKALPTSLPYGEACELIRKYGIEAPDAVLKKLGYLVKWSGLDPTNAIAYKNVT